VEDLVFYKNRTGPHQPISQDVISI